MSPVKREDGLILGGAALAAIAFWKKDEIKEAIVDVITRGRRLTVAPVGPQGVVETLPAALVAAASLVLGRTITQESYDLGRMARSEGAAAGRIRMHVALNDAAAHSWSLHFTITYSTNDQAKGLYGEQYTPAARAPGGLSSVRRYSTAKDPYEGDVVLAERVQLERAQGLDPTGGAVKFLDRESLKVQEGAGSYEDTVAKWAKEGLAPFNLPGYPDDLVVFRRVA